MTNILIPAKGFLSPYKYSYFYEAWNDMRQINIWRLDRITFDKDKSDFRKLDPETQYLVKYLLSSFGINELAIGESWATRAFNHIKNEEVLLALTEILAQESLHAVAYHRLAEEIGVVDELKQIYEASPILKKRTEFLKGDPEDFEKTLAISTLFGEMGSLFISFFLLGDLTRRTGMLSGLNDVNLYSLKDEVINDYSHYKTGLELLKILGFNKKKLKTKYMEEFLTLEDEFIDSLPVKDDLKAELKIYLRWRVIDEAKNLSKCPATMLPFEMVIRGSEMRNMFERKGTNYSTDTFKHDLEGWL